MKQCYQTTAPYFKKPAFLKRAITAALGSLLWLALIILPGQLSAQVCPISLSELIVGDCSVQTGTPTSTISVNVSWSGTAQNGELIYVELSSTDGFILSTDVVVINPASQTSPQTVTFDVLADGNSGQISATSSTNCTPAATQAVDFPMTCCEGNTATICTDGSNAATLTADGGLTQIQWFNESGMIDGQTGNTLVIDATVEPFATDLADGSESYYYEATDANGCSGILCCPVQVFTEVCYDMAFAKKLNTGATPGPFRSGDQVQYTFEVTNQGTRTVYDVDITDYVPAGLTNITYVANSASAGVVTRSGNTFTLDEIAGTDSNGGEPVTVSFEVEFTIDAMFVGMSIINSAEISAFYKDEAGTIPADDEDSTPDDNTDGGLSEDTQDELDKFNDVITDVDNNSPQDNDDAEDDFDAEEIELNRLVAVGNLVFQDVNGDGKFDTNDGDFGLSGVVLELYADNGDGIFNPGLDTKVIVGPDGIPGTPDDNTGQPYVSGTGGIYYFDQLEPGNYFVYIPAVNFEPGNVLSDYVSSLPEDTGETVDDDGNENGQNTLVNGGVVSGLVMLVLDDEPENEAGFDEYPGFLDDNNVNQTVDFGFLACPQMACRDQVNVTLGPDCTFEITPDLLLSGIVLEDNNWYEFYLVDASGKAIQGATLTKDQVGEKVGFAINIPFCDNSPCWGEILVEDKTEPEIMAPAEVELECWLVDEVLNNEQTIGALDLSEKLLGEPKILDGCEGSDLPYTFNDVVEYFECAEDGTYAVIKRTFRVEDGSGHSASATQRIVFKTVAYTDFSFQEDTDDSDGQTFIYDNEINKWVLEIQSCTGSSELVPDLYPVYTDEFGNEVSLDEAGCYLSAETEVLATFQVCGDGYKAEKQLNVFDWCAGGSVDDFGYLVKVGDFEAPVLAPGSCAQATDLSEGDALLADLNGTAGLIDQDQICGMISTGPMDCTGAINTSLAALEDQFGDLIEDCKPDLEIAVTLYSYLPVVIGGIPTGDSSWVRGDYARNGEMYMGLPEGKHLIYFTASDECYNAGSFVLLFQVMDLVKPVMKCDDELRVTLVEGDVKLDIAGYALARVQDVDEGSWDNCELVDMKVRREISGDAAADYQKKYINTDYTLDTNDDGVVDSDDDDFGYTPWRDIVDFFCADVTEIGPDDGGVRVELWGKDVKGNTSICWLDVEVENGTNLGLDIEAIADLTITCEEYAEYLVDGGDFIPEDFVDIVTKYNKGLTGCSEPDAELKYELDLDQCGIGTITISIDQETVTKEESKNYVDISKDEIVVEVVAVHDYWIKFPKDTQVTCKTPEEAGVEVYEGACDLITVYGQDGEGDEIFESTQDPDACYKIFRTYKVINWCEYDGESLPVIVSRDWDAHNGFDGCFVNDDDDQIDPGEYNLNPQEPDGDNDPGDEDIYVIVKIDEKANTAIVYYDNDENPYNTSTANLAGDNSTSSSSSEDDYEGYWWAVTRANDCRGTNSSVWFDNEDNQSPFDIDGNDFQDDNDNRYGSFGYWQYTQHIVVYDDTKPEVTVSVEDPCSIDGVDCNADAPFSIAIADSCSTVGISVEAVVTPGDIVVDLTGNAGNTGYTGTAEQLDFGKYTLTVTVNDGCGNITVVTEDFEVKDCKGPAPICYEGLVVELMPTEVAGVGMAQVWATDYIASDVYDCTGTGADNGSGLFKIEEEAYSIYWLDSLDVNGDNVITAEEFPGSAQSGIEMGCEQLGQLPMVAIFAEDGAGNKDFCITYVEVQDNRQVCGAAAETGDIAGLISTETVVPVEGVEVQLSGGLSMMYMTDSGGDYAFNDVAQGYDYSITPFQDQDHSNGVSTFDLILIQKHILGTKLLDSPYKMIAADANNSKSISTLDLIQIRKLILNIDTEFKNNTSWRFVDADYRFPDATNPWAESFPELRNINNLDVSTTLANFTGLKVGDVNGSARANRAQVMNPRSAKDVMEIKTAEVEMKQGNVYTVSFAADMSQVAGYQFTLDLDADAVALVDIKDGLAKAENFGVFAEEGVITTSFDRDEQLPLGNEVALFHLTLRAKEDVALSEVIGISSRYTDAEAYTLDDEDLAIGLVVGEQYQESGYVLYQNRPNPFEAETIISFKLPEAMESMLEFKDISGRTVLMVEGDHTKGYNEVRVKSDDLPAAGVYFYTLHAGDFTASRKMVLIKR